MPDKMNCFLVLLCFDHVKCKNDPFHNLITQCGTLILIRVWSLFRLHQVIKEAIYRNAHNKYFAEGLPCSLFHITNIGTYQKNYLLEYNSMSFS